MRRFDQLFRQVTVAVSAAFLFSGCISLLTLGLPLIAAQLIDQVIPQYNLTTLAALAVLGAGIMVAVFALEAVRGAILLRAALWFDHVLGQLMLESRLRHAGAGVDIEKDDAALGRLRAFLLSPAVAKVLDTPWLPLLFVGLFFIHPVIGEIALAGALGLVLVAVWQASVLEGAEKLVTRGLRQRDGLRRELGGAGAVIRALGLVRGGAKAWEAVNRGQVAGTYRLGRRATMARALARGLRFAGELAVFGVGALLVMRAEMTLGALVAATLLVSRILAPLERLNETIREVAGAKRALDHFKPMRGDAISPQVDLPRAKAEGRLELSKVSFTYPGRDEPVLGEIDLTVEPGACLVISGPARSGKSTLAALMAGGALATNGEVELDGAPLAHWQLGDGDVPIGYLPDEPLILDGTVHQNIARFGDADLPGITKAARDAGVHDLLSALPNGYDTRTGPAGRALSLRERRAVALARAVHGGPAILVLDTPEAGLAGGEIDQLIDQLKQQKGEGTGLVIASNELRLQALADKVVMLDAGRIVAKDEAAMEAPTPDQTAGGKAAGASERVQWWRALQEAAS